MFPDFFVNVCVFIVFSIMILPYAYLILKFGNEIESTNPPIFSKAQDYLLPV